MLIALSLNTRIAFDGIAGYPASSGLIGFPAASYAAPSIRYSPPSWVCTIPLFFSCGPSTSSSEVATGSGIPNGNSLAVTNP